MTSERPHLAVIGAGPAGLAATLAAPGTAYGSPSSTRRPKRAASSTGSPPASSAHDTPRPCTTSGGPGSGCGTACGSINTGVLSCT